MSGPQTMTAAFSAIGYVRRDGSAPELARPQLPGLRERARGRKDRYERTDTVAQHAFHAGWPLRGWPSLLTRNSVSPDFIGVFVTQHV